MCVRFRGVWPVAPRGLLGLSAALVARCVWLGLVALSIVRCDRLGLAALMNVLRNRLDLPTQRLRREVDWAWPRCLTRIVRLVGFWSSDLRNSRFLPKRGKKGGLAERRASFFHATGRICSVSRPLSRKSSFRSVVDIGFPSSCGRSFEGRVAAIAPVSDLQLAHSLQCVSAAGQSPQQVAIAFLRMTSREGASALRIVVWVACGGRRRT